MVDILLATYNGEKYIEEQLNSLLNQSFCEIKIIIRDDNSTDRTIEIIKEYCDKFPDKVSLVEDNIITNSSTKNFMQLIMYASSEYVMFCDQDDYWEPSKVEMTYKKMKEIEKSLGGDIPVLVYTNYIIVDENLKEIEGYKNNKKIYSKLTFNKLLVENYVTGCTIMINKSLYKNINGYDKRILMHDWWIALYASAFGEISYIPDKLMKYRQHGNNCVGAVNLKSIKYRIGKILNVDSHKSKELCYQQAKGFMEIYGDDLREPIKNKLEIFLELSKYNKIKRVFYLLKGNYLKSDLVRILGQIWFV